MIFFGSSPFGLPALRALHKEGWNIACVITQPDRPSGRGQKLSPTPVKILAQDFGLPVHAYSSLKDDVVRAELAKMDFDFAVVASYGQLIPAETLRIGRLGWMNLHPSLLPRYRGPTPIQTAILNGETETGVTLILLDQQMDHGPIVAQEKIKIPERVRHPVLHDALAQAAAELTSASLPRWIMGEIFSRSQDDRLATFTRSLSRDDGRIDWRSTAEVIDRMIRAYDPWPGTWTTVSGARLKIIDAIPAGTNGVGLVGTATISDDKVFVSCGNNTRLHLLSVQPEGGRIMRADTFLRSKQGASSLTFL